jgi:hypothetical protein
MDFARLAQFPRHILLVLLGDWFKLKDIVKLDTAFGGPRHCDKLCNLINGGMSMSCFVILSKCNAEWLANRKVSLKSVHLKNLGLIAEPSVTACCKHLAHLRLYSQTATTPEDLVLLVGLEGMCRRLESLRCNGRLSKEALALLISRMPSLKSVDFLNCGVLTCGAFDEGFIQLLASYCPRLVEFRLPSGGISGFEMVNLAKKCPNLRVVNTGNVLHHHQQPMPDHSPEFIALCPNLTELCVAVLSEAAILKIAECCPLLTVLDCNCAPDMSNDALEMLTRSCPLIRRLSLQMFENLEARVIWPLANLEELKVADSDAMRDPGVEGIVVSCPKLISVEIIDCKELTEQSASAMLTGLPKLRKLLMHSDAKRWRTAAHSLTQNYLQLHYPHVTCVLEFPDGERVGRSRLRGDVW